MHELVCLFKVLATIQGLKFNIIFDKYCKIFDILNHICRFAISNIINKREIYAINIFVRNSLNRITLNRTPRRYSIQIGNIYFK